MTALDLDFINDFIDVSRRETTSVGLARAFDTRIRKFGITEFVACSLCDFTALPPDAVFINRYNPDWTQHYFAERFFEIDPFFHGGRAERLPFVWSEYLADRSLDRRQRRLFADAAEMGHGFGMTVPIRIAGTYPGCVSLTADRQFELPARHTIHLLSIYLFESARRLAARKLGRPEYGPSRPLTARELECLRWAANGKSAWDMSRILGISEATARFHLSNARRKYGVGTLIQAVGHALLAGDIEL